ncbi:MAG: hypothetical protein IKB13_06490 [Clostridia bacterium]|nr:hypothetical protein [Clostridia bacterium]
MTINYEKKTIEMTKTESREAGNPTSEKFDDLMKLRTAFPDFSVVVKTSSAKRDTLKGLDYDFMKKYIESHDNKDENLKMFYTLRGLNEKGERDLLIEERTCGEVKMWFLATYTEIEKFNNETKKKLNEIKTKRAEARKAS